MTNRLLRAAPPPVGPAPTLHARYCLPATVCTDHLPPPPSRSGSNGGAIFADNDACISTLLLTTFIANGNPSINGGALSMSRPVCKTAVVASSFFNNSGALGGAVYVFSSSYDFVMVDSELGWNTVGAPHVGFAGVEHGGCTSCRFCWGLHLLSPPMNPCRFWDLGSGVFLLL